MAVERVAAHFPAATAAEENPHGVLPLARPLARVSRSFLQAESLQPAAKVAFELFGVDLVRVVSEQALEGPFRDPALMYVEPAYTDPSAHLAGRNTKSLRQIALSESLL